MASIEVRTNAQGVKHYRVKVRLKGQPVSHATFTRLTDAKKWASSTESAIREGRHFPTHESRRHTVSDMIDRYLKEAAPLRPKNLTNTTRHLLWWKSQIGALLLADVGPAQISECRNNLLNHPSVRGKKRTTATVLRYLASISHAYTIATKDWAWSQDNPVLKISKPRAARGRERFLSETERDNLLKACQASSSRFLYPVVVLAISTGMRRGEIMALRWNRVDLQRGQILLTETKNDTSRAIPLSGHALGLMKELSKVRRIDTDIVFYGNDPAMSVDLTKPWKTAVAKAGLRDFRFHDLRHTAASYLAMNGATTVEIAAVLGHKTLQMVKRYSHLAHSHTEMVVAAMNNKIFGGCAA